MNIMDISWDASQQNRLSAVRADLHQGIAICDVLDFVHYFIFYFNKLLLL